MRPNRRVLAAHHRGQGAQDDGGQCGDERRRRAAGAPVGAALVHRSGHPFARPGRDRGSSGLSAPVVRSALKQLAADGMTTLHEGYRLYSVGTTTPTERTYRLMRTVIRQSYEPGERFMTRFDRPDLRHRHQGSRGRGAPDGGRRAADGARGKRLHSSPQDAPSARRPRRPVSVPAPSSPGPACGSAVQVLGQFEGLGRIPAEPLRHLLNRAPVAAGYEMSTRSASAGAPVGARRAGRREGGSKVPASVAATPKPAATAIAGPKPSLKAAAEV